MFIVSINRKNKPLLDVRSTAKILWAMNRMPQVRDEGSGFFRRIHPVTFPPFDGAKVPAIKERITTLEGPGILAWAVEGLKRLRERDAFDVPKSVRAAMVGFEHSNDPAAQFLAEMCEIGKEHSTPVAQLYETYAAWCRLYGYKPKAKNTIGEDWRRLRVEHGKTGKKGHFWRVKIDTTCETYTRLDIRSEKPWF